MKEDPELFSPFLNQSEIDDLRNRIRDMFVGNETIPTNIELPLSQAANRALHEAAEASRSLRHKLVTTGHLLLGLLKVGGSLLSQLFVEKEVEIREVEGLAATQADSRRKQDPLPVVSHFFGILIRMPRKQEDVVFVAEYQGLIGEFTIAGKMLGDSLLSPTATRLIQEWALLRAAALAKNVERVRDGHDPLFIPPLE